MKLTVVIMKRIVLLRAGLKNFLLFLLLVSVAALPMQSVAHASDSGPPQEGVIVLDETKKKPVSEEVKASDKPVLTEQKKQVPQEDSENTPPAVKTSSVIDSFNELSPWTKAGIGAGVILVAGIALSGGGSSGPTYPNEERLVGVWNAQGVRTDGSNSYTGTFTLSAGGTHTYDIILAANNERKTGRGTWYNEPQTYSLILNNDSGSLYIGEFVPGNLSTITLTTSDGRWQLTLTKP